MINIISLVNKKSGAGHISRMINLRKYLLSKKIPSQIYLYNTNKNNYYIKNNNIFFKKFPTDYYGNKNSINIIDFPINFKINFLNKFLVGKIIFFDNKNIKNSIIQKIVVQKNKIIFNNFFISNIIQKKNPNFDFLITTGGITQKNKKIDKIIKSKNFKVFYIGPFLKYSKKKMTHKSYLNKLSNSKCLISNYGISVFESLFSKIPVLINEVKTDDEVHLKKLGLKKIRDINIEKFCLNKYRQQLFNKEFVYNFNDIDEIIK